MVVMVSGSGGNGECNGGKGNSDGISSEDGDCGGSGNGGNNGSTIIQKWPGRNNGTSNSNGNYNNDSGKNGNGNSKDNNADADDDNRALVIAMRTTRLGCATWWWWWR
jgi:hypothetical protein